MTLPTPAEVEVAEWPALKAFAEGLGVNPKGRSGIVRRRVLDRLRPGPGAPEWKAGKPEQAALLNRLGLGEAAADLWESTISLDAPAPWVGLGTAYLSADRPDEAMRCFDRAIGLGDPGARLQKAHAFSESGQEDAALAEVERAVQERPADVRALARRVGLAEAAGRRDEALAAASALAGTGAGRAALARILMRERRFEEAGAALEAHVAERPGDAVAWNNLGACLWKLRRAGDALDAFRRAADLEPRDAGIQNNLAVALAATGREDEALRRIQAARRIAEDPCLVANEAALRKRMEAPARPPARPTAKPRPPTVPRAAPPKKPARAPAPPKRAAARPARKPVRPPPARKGARPAKKAARPPRSPPKRKGRR